MCHHGEMDTKPPYKPVATGQISYPYWTGEGMAPFWIAEGDEWVAKAEGGVVSRKDHPGLYAVIGDSFGPKRPWWKFWGRDKFRLPDLRWAVLVAADPNDQPPTTPR